MPSVLSNVATGIAKAAASATHFVASEVGADLPLHTAESERHLSELRRTLDELQVQVKQGGCLKAKKAAALVAFGVHVPHLTITHCANLFEACRVNMGPRCGRWSFVRKERHASTNLYTAVVGYGRTATYAAIIEMLQQRLVEKYIEKQRRKGRYPTLIEAVNETNVQLDRIMPYLEYKACRAAPLSFVHGVYKVERLHNQVVEATDEIKQRSSAPG